ncbi:MAG: ECF transporter S component [Anaerolineae bacterium]|nr:ECF transporter S component [Anaerolineae bacterium]
MDARLTIRRIVVAGLLGAITILLGATRAGFIPVPTPFGDATIMHIPVIIGAVLDGWLVGAILGLFFGIFSFVHATIPLFKDPLVVFLPRILIGITAALTYRGLRRWNEVVAIIVATVVGTLTNTVGVLGLGVLRNYLPLPAAVGFGAAAAIPESVLAVIIVAAVALAWKGLTTRRRAADL